MAEEMSQSIQKMRALLQALQAESTAFVDRFCDQVDGCENCPIRQVVEEVMNASPTLLAEETLVACEYF